MTEKSKQQAIKQYRSKSLSKIKNIPLTYKYSTPSIYFLQEQTYYKNQSPKFPDLQNPITNNQQRSLRKLQQRNQTIDRWKYKYNQNQDKYYVHLKGENNQNKQKLPPLRIGKNVSPENAMLQSPSKFSSQLKVKQVIVTKNEVIEKKILQKRHLKHIFLINALPLDEIEHTFKLEQFAKGKNIRKAIQSVNIYSSEKTKVIPYHTNLRLSKVIEETPERWDINPQYSQYISNQDSNIQQTMKAYSPYHK